ncbi:positive regulation of dendritic spine morphogenesis [Halocaridina rubra]|uniref:Positive regulation of dendritic spine morphogenesis n=1 Tax=Halocaridina rubra TaxID=373956 RepID=A0AAN8X366_HALRR
MPSASLESESQGSQETLDPFHKVMNLVEKKIRNLEKRKNKLEQYRNDLQAGKDLNDDQRLAVQSFDSVLANLELMREMNQHFNAIHSDHNKQVKKQMKRDAFEKQVEDINRIKEILKIQDVLQQMGREDVRADFLAGTNGAVCMPPENIDYLDSFYKLVAPARTEGQEAEEFQKELKNAAEHIVYLMEGKNKEVAGSTYKTLLNIVDEIASCNYPERKIEAEPEEELLVDSIPEEIAEYTNGVSSEEPDDLTSANDAVLNSIAAEGPPPGLTTSVVTPLQPPTVPQEPQSLVSPSAQDALAAAMAQIPTGAVPGQPPQTTGLPPAPSFFSQPHVQPEPHPPAPQITTQQGPPQQTSVQPPVQPSMQPPVQPQLPQISLNDLVSPGNFDFLQESQVAQEPPTVYMDPAVVSIGSIKTDSLSQKILTSVQPPPQQPTASQVVSLAQEHTHPSSIPAQSFSSQSFSNLNVASYSQGVSVYPSNTDVDASPIPPPPIPLPAQPRTQSQVEFNPEARPWTTEQSAPTQESVPTVPSITQSQDDNWGVTDMPANGGDDKWANDTGTWDEYEDNQVGSSAPPSNGHGDFERRGGYRGGRGRGGGFVPRGFRGNRGGSGNNSGYQNGRGGYGGGYGGGYRSGRGQMGGGGPRGGRGAYRGQGLRGNFRGGRGQRPPYQPQAPHMMQ